MHIFVQSCDVYNWQNKDNFPERKKVLALNKGSKEASKKEKKKKKKQQKRSE